MKKLLLLVAIVAGGAYYYYTQNPGAFGNAGNAAMGAATSDASKITGKAKSYR